MLFVLACSISKAQYRVYPYYNPESEEILQMNNIRFNSKEISDKPEVFNRYIQYLENEEYLENKRKLYEGVGCSGLVISIAGLVTMCCNTYDYKDPRSDRLDNISLGLTLGGLLVSSVGYVGWASYNIKMKDNKKEFVFYLKANNNGLGIITIF